MTSERGFTLIETMVALTVLILGLALFFQGADSGLRGAVLVERERVVAEVASSLMEEVGKTRPLLDGVTEGEKSGLHWRMVITPIAPFDDTIPKRGLIGHMVTLDAGWLERGQSRSFRFQTVCLGPSS